MWIFPVMFERLAKTADNIFELGSDPFIVRNGKIVTRMFARKISPTSGV